MHDVVIIGGGKMGEALLGGLLASGVVTPDAVTVVEPVEARRAELEAAHPGVAVVDTDPPAGAQVIIAVKPDTVEAACRSLAAAAPTRVLSIAAGVTTASLAAWLPPGTPVLRAMPNTPALVGAGASGLAPGASAGDADVAWAAEVLGSVGIVEVCDEADLDAVTGLSGSGPAYVFLLAEALVDAGIAVGLDPAIADRLARQTILGAGRLLAVGDTDPAQLRRNVTSPNGTTAAGLAVFEANDFRHLVAEVVAAATARSIELGRPAE